MTLRRVWIVMGMCLVIACKKDGATPAWMEHQGQLLLVVPAGDGNTIVVQPKDIQVCPDKKPCTRIPYTSPQELSQTCPTCEGCDCRLRRCQPYCLQPYSDYLKENYKLERIPVTPPGPGPDPAPPTTPTAPTTNK